MRSEYECDGSGLSPSSDNLIEMYRGSRNEFLTVDSIVHRLTLSTSIHNQIFTVALIFSVNYSRASYQPKPKESPLSMKNDILFIYFWVFFAPPSQTAQLCALEAVHMEHKS